MIMIMIMIMIMMMSITMIIAMIMTMIMMIKLFFLCYQYGLYDCCNDERKLNKWNFCCQGFCDDEDDDRYDRFYHFDDY